jgi:predicted Rossmann fold nucleotide-binding protein DprA/Smf involved in DNA uptake
MIAIVGWGIDGVYPMENKEIDDEIPERGALVSEFPQGALRAPQIFLPIGNLERGMWTNWSKPQV